MTEASDIRIGPPGEHEPLPDQAAGWAALLHCGEATERDREQFARWLDRSEAHVRAYARAEQTWRDLGLAAERFVQPVHPRTAVRMAGGEAVVTPLDATRGGRRGVAPGPVRRRMLAGAGAIAASLLAAAGVWRIGFYDPVATAAYETALGEVRTVALADGSRITLRPATALSTRLSKAGRKVELARGGAYFAVAPDPGRPFSVRSRATEIRVVGTAFEVLRRPDGVRVAVARGVIEVAQVPPRDGEGAAATRARLRAGQQVLAGLDGTLGEVRAFEADSGLAWRQGRLVFRDARLAEVVAEINGYREDKVVLADPELAELRVTTALRTDETDKLLNALEATWPLTVTRTAEGVVIHAKP